MNSIDQANKEDIIILEDDKLPRPVKDIWRTIKVKQNYIIQQNKLATVYTVNYQQRDINVETINYINYSWQELSQYNLNNNILELFKKRLIILYNLINKKD